MKITKESVQNVKFTITNIYSGKEEIYMIDFEDEMWILLHDPLGMGAVYFVREKFETKNELIKHLMHLESENQCAFKAIECR